jgi:hypothetical protein
MKAPDTFQKQKISISKTSIDEKGAIVFAKGEFDGVYVKLKRTVAEMPMALSVLVLLMPMVGLVCIFEFIQALHKSSVKGFEYLVFMFVIGGCLAGPVLSIMIYRFLTKEDQ